MVKQDRNHILSAGYIRNWAIDDQVMCELLPEGKRQLLSPSQVGVRKKFYAGSPDKAGKRTAAPAESARHLVETRALPLIRNLPDRWPLDDEGDRAWIALWIAMTMCSSPGRRRRIPRTVSRFFADLEREDPTFAAMTRRGRAEFSQPDFELDSMFEEVSSVASLIGQMHWALLGFGKRELVSSDHPVDALLWSAGDPEWHAESPSSLVLVSRELRVPCGPAAALVLSWLDGDDRVPGVKAPRHLAGVVNRGVWMLAERHRFWQPGQTPRGVADGRPGGAVTRELFPDYDPKNCRRLDLVLPWHEARIRAQQAGTDDRSVTTARMERVDGRLVFRQVRHDGEHAEAFAEFSL